MIETWSAMFFISVTTSKSLKKFKNEVTYVFHQPNNAMSTAVVMGNELSKLININFRLFGNMHLAFKYGD